MPIANCLLCDGSVEIGEEIITLWSNESGVSNEHMTINVSRAGQQFGRAYKVMCSLYLPTAWGSDSIKALQLGLCRALAKSCKLSLEEIHIITLYVQSGCVVEDGKCQAW